MIWGRMGWYLGVVEALLAAPRRICMHGLPLAVETAPTEPMADRPPTWTNDIIPST